MDELADRVAGAKEAGCEVEGVKLVFRSATEYKFGATSIESIWCSVVARVVMSV